MTDPLTQWLDEMEAKARAATPGPWMTGSWSGQCHLKHQHVGQGVCWYEYTLRTGEDYADRTVSAGTAQDHIELIGGDDYGPILSRPDAAYIAALPPETVSALLECVRAASWMERPSPALEMAIARLRRLAGREG